MSRSGEGGWRVGSEAETAAAYSSVAAATEWTEACPEVCQSFLLSLFPSSHHWAGLVLRVPEALVQVGEEEEGVKSGPRLGCCGRNLPT